MSLGTIAVLLILAAIIAVIVISMIRNGKKGRSSCGCGCGGCPNSSLCKGKVVEKPKRVVLTELFKRNFK